MLELIDKKIILILFYLQKQPDRSFNLLGHAFNALSTFQAPRLQCVIKKNNYFLTKTYISTPDSVHTDVNYGSVFPKYG